MILDSLVILIMKNVNIARLYFLYGGLYWKILAENDSMVLISIKMEDI